MKKTNLRLLYATVKEIKMRHLSPSRITLILMLSLLFVGCKDDDPTEELQESNGNSFIYDGTSYSTPNAYLEVFGPNNDEESADFDLILTSVQYDATEDEFFGTGEAINIDLNSPSLSELASGTYTYDADFYYAEESTGRKPNTFVDVILVLGNDTESEIILYTDENSNGTVVINKSGEIYEIDYIFTLENDEEVEGYFRGELQLID